MQPVDTFNVLPWTTFAKFTSLLAVFYIIHITIGDNVVKASITTEDWMPFSLAFNINFLMTLSASTKSPYLSSFLYPQCNLKANAMYFKFILWLYPIAILFQNLVAQSNKKTLSIDYSLYYVVGWTGRISEKSKIASLTWLAAGPGCVDSSSDDVSRSLGYP